MSILEKTYALDFDAVTNNAPHHYIIIGNGGTGGFLVPNLVRQISIKNYTRKEGQKHMITLADPDKVEEKNLTRQNFIMPDLNKSKAMVLAARYSNAFGTPINAHDAYVETKAALKMLMDLHKNCYPIIIGAVDNNKTRQLIADLFYSGERNMVYLDSGNELYNGQVVLGVNHKGTLQEGNNKPHSFYMPCVTDVFHDVMNDTNTKFTTELSCAERAISHPQSMATNSTAAMLIFNFCNVLLNNKEMGGLRVNAVTFNVKNNGFDPKRNTKDQLNLRYIKKQAAAAG